MKEHEIDFGKIVIVSGDPEFEAGLRARSKRQTIAALNEIFEHPDQNQLVKSFALEQTDYFLRLSCKKHSIALLRIFVDLVKEDEKGQTHQIISENFASYFDLVQLADGSSHVSAQYRNPTEGKPNHLGHYSIVLQEVDEIICEWWADKTGHNVKRVIEAENPAILGHVRKRRKEFKQTSRNVFEKTYEPTQKE